MPVREQSRVLFKVMEFLFCHPGARLAVSMGLVRFAPTNLLMSKETGEEWS